MNKALQSELATKPEKEPGGQQFRLVDPPSLPLYRQANRLKISLEARRRSVPGLVLAFLLDLKDRSFHSEKELSRHFGAPDCGECAAAPHPGGRTPAHLAWCSPMWLGLSCCWLYALRNITSIGNANKSRHFI